MKGQIAITTLTGVGALIAAIAAPVLWVGGIKEVNAVQDVQIQNLITQQAKIEASYQQLNNKIDALLLRNGIDPEKVTSYAP